MQAVKIITKLLAAGMLVGALGQHDYDYYTLLRWVVCGVSAFAAVEAFGQDKRSWTWTLSVVAIFFNPLLPVRLERDTWAFIDLFVAVILLLSIVAINFRAPLPGHSEKSKTQQ